MIINHNVNAMIAYRNIMINGALAGKSMERLASGMRINRASDDPAGLAISEKMRAQIRGLEMASRWHFYDTGCRRRSEGNSIYASKNERVGSTSS
ncbi:hypothetical protein NPD3_2663 [Clostridium botulinum]|nr:hypothetical protein NPD3_2663 [Clostridium botulinum]